MNRKWRRLLLFVAVSNALSAIFLTSCGSGGGNSEEEAATEQQSLFAVDTSVDLREGSINNLTVYITSQCYTKTRADDDSVFNPCYTCHQAPVKPNFLDDSGLQNELDFAGYALENPFTNLFEDRSARVAAISDKAILEYIATDNYQTEDGTIILAELLGSGLPDNWDLDGDKKWDGYIPDCHFNFDTEGFDRDPESEYTGWRAFGYYPFLGTFWPTNGSTDDVLIRLDTPFRQDEGGQFDLEVYKLNLAIVEAIVKQTDVDIDPVTEVRYQVDLNDNGVLDEATTIHYKSEDDGSHMSYVGRARQLLQMGDLKVLGGLYPVGTEFLHSVRYIQPHEDGSISLAKRMKELRYARKANWYNYNEIKGVARREANERIFNEDAIRSPVGDFERGMRQLGWRYQGFIEDRIGNLRPQSREESFFCMGCHYGTGATMDTVFSFTRKFGHSRFQQGWYHWSQKGLANIPEPIREDGHPEYTYYLEQNRAGDEFRANDEVISRFFNEDGSLKADEIDALHDDISLLLFPSRERALMLNKAYKVIVEDQDFAQGRDATVTPVENVHRTVTRLQPTGIDTPVAGPGRIGNL